MLSVGEGGVTSSGESVLYVCSRAAALYREKVAQFAEGAHRKYGIDVSFFSFLFLLLSGVY